MPFHTPNQTAARPTFAADGLLFDTLPAAPRTELSAAPTLIPERPERDIPFADLLAAGFRQDNSIGSLITAGRYRRPAGAAGEPDFDPLPMLEDRYLAHATHFVDAESAEDVSRIKRRLDAEAEDKRLLAEGGLAGMAASLAAGLTDPINFIPVGGQIYRSGRIGASVARSALSTGAAGAAAGVLSEGALQATQLTRTPQESAEAVAASAMLSGVFGAAAPLAYAAFARGRGHATLSPADAVGLAERQVAADLAPRAVGLPDPAVEPHGVRISAADAEASIAAERAALRDAYGDVRDRPDGPSDDPLVLIKPEDIEGTIVSRGGFRELGGADVSGSGWGLVKFIWKHGEKSNKAAVKQVTEADVVNFPNVIREYEPSVRGETREWIVPRGDGETLVYVDRKFVEDGQRRTVSIFVQEKPDGRPLSARLNDGKGTGPAGSPDRAVQGPAGDTTGPTLRSADQSQRGPADASIDPPSQSGNPAPGGGSLSAASAAENVLHERLKSALGVEKATAFQSPMLRLATAGSVKARQMLQLVAETPFMYEKNALGIASPVSAETRVKLRQAPLAEALAEVDRQWLKHRGIEGGSRRLREAADLLRSPEAGQLPRRAFMEEVGRAMRRGDAHEIPEVAAAARELRRKVFDPLKDAAIREGLLPEDVAVETATSYLSRVYDIERMKARKPDFIRTVGNWLESEQAEKATLQSRLRDLDTDRDDLVRLLDQTDAKIARRESALGKLTARVDEAGKALKTAVQRGFDLGGRRDAADIESRTLKVRANEADYQGRRLSSRSQALQDRLSGITHDADALRLLRDDIDARLTDNGKAMDDIVARWPGKSDTPDAILKADTSRERVELDDVAAQIYDHILRTPGGRAPYEAAPINRRLGDPAARGPMKARAFNIPDAMIEDFLINDVGVIARNYSRTMSPDIELKRALGSIDGADWMGSIRDDYNQLIGAAKSEKERRALERQSANTVRDAEAIIQRLRGTYAAPADPDHWAVRTSRLVRDWNYLRMLGMMTTSAIPDMGRPVMVYGIGRVLGSGLAPLMRDPAAFKLLGREVQHAAAALDMVLDSRALNLADIGDDYGRLSKFERGVQAMADNFGVVTLMAPWNATMKQFAGAVASQAFIDDIRAVVRGGAAAKVTERLAAAGIDRGRAGMIAKQLAEHGENRSGLVLPNTERWTDAAAVESFRAAILRDVDRVIITPGIGDRPLWMSSELGKLIGQFKSFAFASAQRVAIAGLQQRDAAALNGLLLMTGLGMLTYGVQGTLAGRTLSDDPAIWLSEGIDKAGYTGWLYDVNNIVEKASRGRLGIHAMTGGPPISRYASRNVIGALLGPSAGTVADMTQVMGGAASGEWTETESRAVRRLLPYQNLFYLRRMLDQAEASINDAFGVQ
ncbi:hypothetical protein [Ferrovibrio terrae]|uniref:hypothetical protein n=1 Tax=Ferrovibrio terrae TaxID=2594003 RepID=UPI003137D46B